MMRGDKNQDRVREEEVGSVLEGRAEITSFLLDPYFPLLSSHGLTPFALPPATPSLTTRSQSHPIPTPVISFAVRVPLSPYNPQVAPCCLQPKAQAPQLSMRYTQTKPPPHSTPPYLVHFHLVTLMFFRLLGRPPASCLAPAPISDLLWREVCSQSG